MGDGFERFRRTARTARQIHDDRFRTHRGHAARENRSRSIHRAFAPHVFGNAGNEAVRDAFGGFGSVVARADASTAGGEHEIETAGVRPFAQLLADAGGIVSYAE